jgi:hypothetical protein
MTNKLLAWLFKNGVTDSDFEDLKVQRSLEQRVIYCANCEGTRLLRVNCCGSLVCESCFSEHWTFDRKHAFLDLEARIVENIQQIIELERIYQE